MDIIETFYLIVIIGCMFQPSDCSNDSVLKHRQRRFGGPMGGGGPFHGGGSMDGPMGGPMGGMMSGMSMGPHAPGMGPSMGGPNKQGQGSAVFTSPQGFKCMQRDIVCPKWCLIEDENGCKSCPCGPAGGMSSMAGGPSGGPSGGPMGGMMSSGSHGSHTSGSSGGTTGSMGGGHVVSGTSVATSGSGGSKPITGVSTSGSTTNYIIIGGSHTTGVSKPVHECKATLLCASTCSSGYQLGTTSNTGCRSCTCPTSHHVSTTTIHYIVKPSTRECTNTAYCMSTCHGGYVMEKTDTHGCPVCTCLQVKEPYKYPIEIAVEPPPYTDTIPTATVTCAIRPCAAGCKVGYKCGTDGCPTCECIHPAVVGLSTVNQVYVQRPRSCRSQLACTSSCSVGYKCDTYGCPSCQCLVHVSNTYTQTRPQYVVNTKPQYIVQTCTHTLTCASTCSHGYTLIKDGTGGCSKCQCKPQIIYQTKPIYAVQRPKPQYQIVTCQSSSACAASCSHGYEMVSGGGACPECRCKPAPVYTYTSTGCGSGCTDTNNNALYITGNAVIESGYTGNTGGTSYVVRSNSNIDAALMSGVGGYQSDALSCPPLPPNCDPSCIKYDTPRCRKCECHSSIFGFGKK